ncbi:hypothetical protein [Pseudooceanicola sp. HF7]|uniref:hypothetical protein n=1 Tax=Pseudooceanicola sp. HF7 TaxID=2721560 RepID=UPI0014311CD6|nr:hypothetical protein [Pseudooceanicola sp. HF7]NIZ07920.1 hypothetical protein [Pseudooceanicola sp. HF7]
MTGRNGKKGESPQTREERLKAALKANLGRRKAQARARACDDATENPAAGPDADNKEG